MPVVKASMYLLAVMTSNVRRASRFHQKAKVESVYRLNA